MLFASLFSGFGLADIGALQAGFEPIWGVEIDPLVAEVSRQLKHTIYNQSVLDINWNKLEKPTDLWVSPPCQKFSDVNPHAGETPLDIELAKAVCEAIKTFQPDRLYLENVNNYKRSDSLRIIEHTLFSFGYIVDCQVVDAVRFGVAQNRRRFILRAIKGEFVPPLPLQDKQVGWFEAIADLIPGLPEVELAPWQSKRLPDWVHEQNTAALVEGAGANTKRLKVRPAYKPCWTIRASLGANRNISRLANAVIGSRTVALTPRALSRFQTLPDWFELPSKVSLAVKGIGNGVPCKLAETIIKSCQ